ncbi:MAG TPA: Mrp/NBP35 family ATP-binding protein [Haliscomenobacter sp.]|uniref:Mrp/NBP35 family ATP-binding protein n=1 Tax=Haliscomenobacter sp. TaxID=2717303 RepID=UPI002C9964BE|nr:Mrp/NBP35 family ATP-binding protein [Haliscomenobacter sp.]HOY16295.1 Mrp/NBP35 family ATP-binding protein [Haliscomenobacter sp.]
MSIDTSSVVRALAKVSDPVTGQDLITANMVRDLNIEGDSISFTLELASLNAQHKSELNFACQGAIAEVYPQAKVHVHMMSRTADPQQQTSALPQVKNVIAVASGKGGVGKSTIAANLALGLRMLGARVGLVDADIYGPSVPTMFGLQGQRPKVRDVYGQPKMVPLDAYGIALMSIGFIIEPEQAVVLRGPRLAGIIKQFFNDCLWPELDYLVVDLPPGTGDVQLTLVQTVPVTGAIIVTTPQEVAVIDAVKASNMFQLPGVAVPLLGVVENMSWFTPKELPDHKYLIFGQGGGKKLALVNNTVLLGQVPLVQGIREAGDGGRPIILDEEDPISREAFLNVAKNVARQVAIRNETIAPTQVVKMA